MVCTDVIDTNIKTKNNNTKKNKNNANKNKVIENSLVKKEQLDKTIEVKEEKQVKVAPKVTNVKTHIKENFAINYGVKIYPFESNDLNQSYKEGEEYGYVLEKAYSPIILSSGELNLKINRYTIINFYN